MGKFKENFETDRDPNQIRDIQVELDFTPNALASILYKQGNTVVLCCVTKQDNLPRWFPRNATKGWVHAEYSLLPASTDSRFRRERNGAKGRTQEIERLIARSLRAAVNLEALGPIALDVDCDILNADGGTRCASISAANIALRLAIRRLIRQGVCLPASLRKTDENKEVKKQGKPYIDLNSSVFHVKLAGLDNEMKEEARKRMLSQFPLFQGQWWLHVNLKENLISDCSNIAITGWIYKAPFHYSNPYKYIQVQTAL